jgi:hypothetical protein
LTLAVPSEVGSPLIQPVPDEVAESLTLAVPSEVGSPLIQPVPDEVAESLTLAVPSEVGLSKDLEPILRESVDGTTLAIPSPAPKEYKVDFSLFPNWMQEISAFNDTWDWSSRRRSFHLRSDPGYVPQKVKPYECKWTFEKTTKELRMIGAIIAEHSLPSRGKRQPIHKLHPIKGQRIPAWSKGFIACKTPGRKNGTWLVTSSNGFEKGRGWASPACLVKAEDGIVYVPIVNADERVCRGSDVRGRIQIEDFVEEMEIPATGKEARIIAAMTEIEPEWYNSPIESFDQLLDKNLTSEQAGEIKTILERHRGLFSKKKGMTHLVEHHILTGEAKPISTRPARVSPPERVMIRKLVQAMIDDGVVEPSNSPWSSRVVLAPKPNGGIRFCVDFRNINKLCIPDVHPLPVMDDLIGHLDGATYYSSVDLESGFWQIPLASESRPRSAFVTPDGLYQFTRLPFGLQASPPNFQRLMNRVLKDLLWTECLCYLDDILIYGKTWEEHNSRLEKVLTALVQAGLTLNPKKCVFGARSVKFLGHIVDVNGLQPNPKKVEAIRDFPRPGNATQLRGLIGMASFYRKFVKGFSAIVKPLNELLKKDADVARDWNEEHEEAVRLLKEAMLSTPILCHDDGVSQLELQTDASGKGLGAVLLLHKEGLKRPVAYASRKLTEAEEKYHVNELEFLALIWALERFRTYVYGRNCIVKTDSSVVKWVAERAQATQNKRMLRWLVELRGFDISVEHMKGTSNIVADTLSRNPVGGEPDPHEHYIGALIPIGYEPRDLAILQRADEDIEQLVLTLQDIGERPFKDTEGFILNEGILYKRNRRPGRPHLLVVPSAIRQSLIHDYHDLPTGGHLGRSKTLSRLQQRYYWKNMERSVRHYVRSCPFCQVHKPRVGRKAGKLQPLKPPVNIFDQVGVDHLGPFKTTDSGNQHLIVLIDYLSRYLEVEAVPSTDSESVVNFFKTRIFARFGWPSTVISDAGTAFSSHQFQDFMEMERIRHIMASVEHPQTNGLVEKANFTIANALAAYVNFDHTDWDLHIPEAIFAINTAKQETTKISPYELVFGHTAVTSTELAFPWPKEEAKRTEDFFRKVWRWRKVAREMIVRQQAKSKREADRYVSPGPTYRRGDLVVVYKKRRGVGLTKKLLPRAVGPYQVLKKISPVCYRLEDIPHNQRNRLHRIFNVHISVMKPYLPRREIDWCLEDDISCDWGDEEDEMESTDQVDGSEDGFLDGVAYDNDVGGPLEVVGDDGGLETDVMVDEDLMGKELGWGTNGFINPEDLGIPDLSRTRDEGQEDEPEVRRGRVALPPTRSGRKRWAPQWEDHEYEEMDEHDPP